MQEPAEMRPETSGREHSLPVQDNICQTRAERERLRSVIQEYVLKTGLTAPLTLDELYGHADRVLARAGLEARYRDYASVFVHNEVWRTRLAGIPFDRRLLLLPKCLRNPDRCQGRMDEFGLVCARCGGCVMDEIHAEAEDLGYVVMVAEGSPLVMALIESGQVEAVVGVSCLSVLEKVFPYMEAAALPGMAIPLLREGCEKTAVDLDWVWDAIYLSSKDSLPRLNLEALRREVKACFLESSLNDLLGPIRSETEAIARTWLAKEGKRWRPFLAACVYQTLQDRVGEAMPKNLQQLMVAVESFHKASLIHDDIEDEDVERYGEKTLHVEYGVPVALNAGDFLLGEGYRLIGELDLSSEQKVRMLQVAAGGHRTLCMGQGAELCWLLHRRPLSTSAVLSIFRQKTAPAFEVALHLGAIYAGADDGLVEVLHQFSEALGVAYQIRDDLADSGLEEGEGLVDPAALGPSLLLALAHEKARDDDRRVVESIWRNKSLQGEDRKELASIMKRLGMIETARSLLERYRKQAIQAVSSLENLNLKIALHRVVGKIFSDRTVMGCCNDHQAGNTPRRGAGKEASE